MYSQPPNKVECITHSGVVGVSRHNKNIASVRGVTAWKPLSRILGAILAAALGCALALTPLVAIGGVAAARTNETMQSNLQDLTDGFTPGVTTFTDKDGTPFAWFYDQRRFEVESDQISQAMKDAIVSIEDRRFYEHKGVDIQGNIRAMFTNFVAGGVEQGASTLDQQYVKNYLLLVASKNEEEQAAAIETSVPRKLREMRMASAVDELLSKDEVLTRYLNIVPFGNGAYGIEAAAQTYFGIPAAELNIPQSAMLAGMVQSSSYLNPYTNEEKVLERRSLVFSEMVRYGAITQEEADAFNKEPLGVLEEPNSLPNGCITAENKGFFCDYVMTYLQENGLTEEDIMRGGLTVKTTLDPAAQEAAHNAVTSQVPSQTTGVAEVMNIVEPGQNSRRILAMTSSRDYGLDPDSGQTVLPQPTTLVGNGAGSVFKIFTAAVALQNGYGLETRFDVPKFIQVSGMGTGGAAGCPAGMYCVENAGDYAGSMTMREALAHSPNTTFIKLIEEVGVPQVVDMSVKLGLRSYAAPGSYDGEESIADHIKNNNLGSYTLGPTPVNALELSNVAATISSGGVWCEPNPVEEVKDHNGKVIDLDTPECEDVLNADVAYALASGMSADITIGTAAAAANGAGWSAPLAAKTGTTESHQSAAFMGFNDRFAAATYVYNDGTTVSPLCTSPISQCSWGTLFGGFEPARTWFAAANAVGAYQGGLPTHNPEFANGRMSELSEKYSGRNADEARKALEKDGYIVQQQMVAGRGKPRNTVVRVVASEPLNPGDTVILHVSDGTAPPRSSSSSRAPQPNGNVNTDQLEQDLDAIADELINLFGGQ